MGRKILEDMTQEQLEWLAHEVVLALRAGSEAQKAKKALRDQTTVLEQNILIPVGQEIKRRKNNG